MWLMGRKIKDGVYVYEVKGNDGTVRTYSADLLKSYVKTGKIVLDNATLSPAGRLMINKSAKPVKTKKIGYPRTLEIQKMTRREKADYYWDTLLEHSTLSDMSIFTVDELESILEGSLSLEVGDHGSSGVDIALGRNLYCYSGVAAVLRECQRRKYLTEKECHAYLLECDTKGRICNHYTFAEWIMKHKK